MPVGNGKKRVKRKVGGAKKRRVQRGGDWQSDLRLFSTNATNGLINAGNRVNNGLSTVGNALSNKQNWVKAGKDTDKFLRDTNIISSSIGALAPAGELLKAVPVVGPFAGLVAPGLLTMTSGLVKQAGYGSRRLVHVRMPAH